MRAILSFGVPASISIFLLLAVNIFLVKKNADGDYIDNELRYEIINNSETSFERFLQYQEQGYLDYETIVYEGEEVIKLRNDLIISMQKLDSPDDDTENKFLVYISLEDELKNVEKAIERHNRSSDTGRLLMSAILILFPIYILPVSISFFRFHNYRWPITIITVFTGWTVIGFVLMLTWSVWPKGKFS
jgi:hypothetical protein